MRKPTLLAAAAILISTAAVPAMAQTCAKYDPTCQIYAHPSTQASEKSGAARAEARPAPTSNTRGDHRYRSTSRKARVEQREAMRGREYNNGYYAPRPGPGDVVGGAVGAAAGVAAGAVNTAGAIATAPFRSFDSYAYDSDGYYGGGPQSYAKRNGFVCTPGAYFKGADGRQHLCQ